LLPLSEVNMIIYKNKNYFVVNFTKNGGYTIKTYKGNKLYKRYTHPSRVSLKRLMFDMNVLSDAKSGVLNTNNIEIKNV